MGRLVLHWVCVFALVALPVGGCSDESTGGSGGMGGTGGAPNECLGAPDGTACTDGECLDGVCAREGAFSCTEQGIRDAIAEGGGPHFFACDGPTTVTTEAEILIDNDVILDGEGELTVDGNDAHTVFLVPENVTAELHGFTVTRANGRGAICVFGTLTLTNITVTDNNNNSLGATGGGIVNQGGTVTMTNSTVSGNTTNGGGGGITNFGELTMTNSTVSGNAGGVGGIATAFMNQSERAKLVLVNSTVSGNTSSIGGTLAIVNLLGPPVALTGTIVDGECEGAITSNGHNIQSPGNNCGFDQASDLFDVTPAELNLEPLADNGGPTQTHALLPGSVAIDVIPEAACEVDEDQRGEPRPGGSMCDVGAFEVQP